MAQLIKTINGLAIGSVKTYNGLGIASVKTVNGLDNTAGGNSLLTSLISYWQLDEASGDAIDAHGSNDLTDNATVTSTTGIINGGRQYTRANSEYHSHADNADLSVGDIDFTVSCWAYFDADNERQMLVAKGAGAATAGQALASEYMLYRWDDERVYFTIGNNVSSNEAFTTALSTSTWYHIVGWHDSVNNQIGIAVNAGTPATVSWSGGSFDSGLEFALGRSTLGNYHNGRLDEVGFWKRVLTSDERTLLYNSGAGYAYSNFS